MTADDDHHFCPAGCAPFKKCSRRLLPCGPAMYSANDNPTLAVTKAHIAIVLYANTLLHQAGARGEKLARARKKVLKLGQVFKIEMTAS